MPAEMSAVAEAGTGASPAKNAAISSCDLVASGEDAPRYMALARADSAGRAWCVAGRGSGDCRGAQGVGEHRDDPVVSWSSVRKCNTATSSNTSGRPRSIAPVAAAPAKILARLAQAAEDRGHAVAGGEQGVGVAQRDPVVVDIHHRRAGDHPAGHLVHVVHGGQAAARVGELAQALLRAIAHPRPRNRRFCRAIQALPGKARSS